MTVKSEGGQGLWYTGYMLVYPEANAINAQEVKLLIVNHNVV